jgi:hypothetical protein
MRWRARPGEWAGEPGRPALPEQNTATGTDQDAPLAALLAPHHSIACECGAGHESARGGWRTAEQNRDGERNHGADHGRDTSPPGESSRNLATVSCCAPSVFPAVVFSAISRRRRWVATGRGIG